jgi:hypothetical protein
MIAPSYKQKSRTRMTRAATEFLPATLTATTAATTTAAAAWLILGFVDFERSSAHVLAIEILDRTGRIGAWHFDESEAARASGFTIHDHGN